MVREGDTLLSNMFDGAADGPHLQTNLDVHWKLPKLPTGTGICRREAIQTYGGVAPISS